MGQPIFITDSSILCALGDSPEQVRKALLAGQSGLSALRLGCRLRPRSAK